MYIHKGELFSIDIETKIVLMLIYFTTNYLRNHK